MTQDAKTPLPGVGRGISGLSCLGGIDGSENSPSNQGLQQAQPFPSVTAAKGRLDSDLESAPSARLIKFLGLLGSEHDGEIANAGRLARLVRSHGLTWDGIIVPARDHLWDWRQAEREILASEQESDWERGFCWGLVARWRGPVLTPGQEATLKRIFEKYCRRAA